MTWSTLLPNWPTGNNYSQLHATTWDGDVPPGPNGDMDCGPTCITAITRWMTGVYVPPDSIIDAMKGVGYRGPTSLTDLTTFLQNECSIPTTVKTPQQIAGTAEGSLLNLEWQATVAGEPVILYRWWDHPQSGFEHWAICIGLDPTTVAVFDPWTGTVITETYQQHEAMYLGLMIVIERTRDPNL